MTSIDSIIIRSFKAGDQIFFERLNREWIEQYFVMEPVDVMALGDPQTHILLPGGSILMAEYRNQIAGTVALKKVTDSVYEFTKMAVDARFRGRSIGRALGEAAIQKAVALGATSVILYSHSKLVTAIALYHKLGFKPVPLDGPYKRSDIKMELKLN